MPASQQEREGPQPLVSVVMPAHNEVESIPALIDEIAATLAPRGPFEVIVVNDGSTDATESTVRALAATRPWLRQIRHSIQSGKAAAERSGVLAARAEPIVTLDGDGQNDPAYIPRLLDALAAGGAKVGLIVGQRVGRKDSPYKRLQSRIANGVRGAILHDATRDTGCGLKAYRRAVYLSLPFFDALHRFLPALVRREGYLLEYVQVVDRPRRFGTSHFGMWNRLWIGIVDLMGVFWLIRRRERVPEVTEVFPDAR